MHEVLVNCLGGLSLPRKSVVRLTERPDMTLDVYRGRKTTIQQQPFVITLVTSFIIQFQYNFTQVLDMTLPRTSSHFSVIRSRSQLLFIPPAYEVCHGGIMFSSFLCVCVCVSVNNFHVRSITLKPLNIFS